MTRITIVASGTRGDVQPYVALGKGLQDAGFDVHLLSSSSFSALAEGTGITFHSIGPNVEEMVQSDEWRKVLESGNFLKILARMQTESKRNAEEMARLTPPLLEGADLILTGMGGIGGISAVADTMQIPMLLAYLFPFTPTREFPSPLVPTLPFGAALNRLSFHVTRQMFWQTSKVVDTTMRQRLGLKKGSFWGPFRQMAQRNVPVMHGYSQQVLPRPSDWPHDYSVTGYWFLDAPQDWHAPADLLAFLEAGPLPVYIGFGSMGSRKPEEAGRIALEALALSGQRGLLATGWGGLKLSDLPPTVHMISSIPHQWLFERMGAVVHHGGAGTTAAGLRAGVPSIIVPFMGDQPFWGRRVMDMGVGPAPILRRQLSAQRLAQAITTAMTDQAMRARAADLGGRIRAEDGIANAVEFVTRAVESGVRATPALAH
ncbi:MAG: glycosyltransferase [Pleurocapsa minor GSE-CHR-MK-17-07R]|jgi:sterol 3beta-glucosyltransferase|nr:glycosyltransferase [Pleurocapsa minor GSE-CHR-MK 17-07R]